MSGTDVPRMIILPALASATNCEERPPSRLPSGHVPPRNQMNITTLLVLRYGGPRSTLRSALLAAQASLLRAYARTELRTKLALSVLTRWYGDICGRGTR
eukprot:1730445-Rhodomonas_salina.1